MGVNECHAYPHEYKELRDTLNGYSMQRLRTKAIYMRHTLRILIGSSRTIMLYGLVSLALNLQAQEARKGFKLLEKADYDKALSEFNTQNNKYPGNPAVLLGLSFVYADEKSPHFDLILAWECGRQVSPLLSGFTPDDLENIGDYFTETETRISNRPVKKKIEYALETIEAKLIKYIREENNLDLVYAVIEKFPDFRHYDNVIHIRNQLEFRKFEKQHTLEGYLEFLEKFPEAAQVDKARRYCSQLAFESASKANTIQAFKDYIFRYPDAAEMTLATRRLHAAAYQAAKAANSIPALEAFMQEYPDALEQAEARQHLKLLLYEHARTIHTLEAYNAFIEKYPEGSQYVDIFNLKSLDRGMQGLTVHEMPGDHVLWARSFEDIESVELSACLDVDTFRYYLTGGTVIRKETAQSDAWVIKTDTEGKLIWQKFIGEMANEQLLLLASNQKGEIFGAGFTQLGEDSSSRSTWLFKLSSEGNRLWQKKTGRLRVSSIAFGRDGRIYLSGGQPADSSGSNCALLVLNSEGRMLWSRNYTAPGEVIALSVLPDDHLIVMGNTWKAKMTIRGYIVWESSFHAGDSMLSATIGPAGEAYVFGIRNRSQLVVAKVTSDNKTLFEKILSVDPVVNSVQDVLMAGKENLIVLGRSEQGQQLFYLNPVSGELKKSIHLPSGLNFVSMGRDSRDNLLLSAFSGEIVLIKNAGPVL